LRWNGYANYGDGIYCRDSSPTITNCTISENTDGGICCSNFSVTLKNCLLWNDSPQEICVYLEIPVVKCSDTQSGWEGKGTLMQIPHSSHLKVPGLS